MDDLQEKLSSMLNDPQTMQQIMALAGQLGQTQQEPPPQEASTQPLSGLDLSMLQKLSGLAGQGTIDKDQQGLLRALRPYLSSNRIARLERAMRAARMAGMATSLLGLSGSAGG